MGPTTRAEGRWITQVQRFNKKWKKAGNEDSTVFSGGGKQKGERKRLKGSSSSNETRSLREKLPRKAHPIPRSELPSPLAPHLLSSTGG